MANYSEWLSSNIMSGSNDGTITLTGARNTGITRRSSTVSISTANGSVTRTVTVTQLYYPRITKSGGDVSGEGGTVYMTVYSPYTWWFKSIYDWITITDNTGKVYEDEEWVAPTPDSGKTFIFTVDRNPSTTEVRNAAISIGFKRSSGSAVTASQNIRQLASDPEPVAELSLGVVTDGDKVVSVIPAQSGAFTYYLQYTSSSAINVSITNGTLVRMTGSQIVFTVPDNETTQFKSVLIQVSNLDGLTKTKNISQLAPAAFLNYDQNKCVSCGQCDGFLGNCPVGLSVDFDSGFAGINNLRNCIGCGGCNPGVCPNFAFSLSAINRDMLPEGTVANISVQFNGGNLRFYLDKAAPSPIQILMDYDKDGERVSSVIDIQTGARSKTTTLTEADFDVQEGTTNIVRLGIKSGSAKLVENLSTAWIDRMIQLGNHSYMNTVWDV